jgi:hypothetical protein
MPDGVLTMTENDFLSLAAFLAAQLVTVRLVLKHRAAQKAADRKAAKEASQP